MKAGGVRLLTAAAFLAGTVLLAAFALTVFAPQPRLAPVVPYGDYTLDAVRQALSPETVAAEQDRIVGMGSRFLGQPGLVRVEEYVRERFRAAGLQVYEQSRRTPAPQTLRRAFLLADAGAPGGYRTAEGVEIFPFWPNHLQPMVTPPGGLAGELVLVTEEVLRSRESFRGCIALVDTGEGRSPMECRFDWTAYASLGFEALILSHAEGLEAMPWPRIVGDAGNPAGGFINGSVPVNYVRLAATPEVFDHVGRHVKLDVETRWANVPSASIYGILRAAQPSREAVLVAADYDASAILPDRAPGVVSALDTAVQLCLIEALAPHRDTLKRDVVFAAFAGRSMCEDGARDLLRVMGIAQSGAQGNRLLSALGADASVDAEDAGARARSRLEVRLGPIGVRQHRNRQRSECVERVMKAFDDPAFFSDPARSRAVLDGFDRETRAFFEGQYDHVMNTLALERSEEYLQAKLASDREAAATPDGPLLGERRAAKRHYDEAQTSAGYPLDRLLAHRPEYVAAWRVRERFTARLEELQAHHRERDRALAQDAALVTALNPYDEVVTLLPGLAPAFGRQEAAETVGFGGGTYLIGTPERVFENLLSGSRQRAGLEDGLHLPTVDRWHDQAVWRAIGQSPYGPGDIFRTYGYQAFRLLNFGRTETYARSSDPVDLPFMRDVGTLRRSLLLTGEVALSLAHGAGRFPPLSGDRFDFAGRVLVSNVGPSTVPRYRLANALLGTRSRLANHQFAAPGYYDVPFAFADPYGEFDLYNSGSGGRSLYNSELARESGFSLLACGFGPDGLIAYMKDEGEEAQRMYRSTNVGWNDRAAFQDLTLVTFRAAPVTLLDLENPQTGDLYGWVELVDRDGLAPLRKQCVITVKTPFVTFVEPDKRVYVKLQAGSAENRLALVTRAFMLGPTDQVSVDSAREIDGRGYLAADAGIVRDVPLEVSQAMSFVNGRRIALLNRHGMADQRAQAYQAKGEILVEASRKPGGPYREARLAARDAVTYHELNHPVLRRAIGEAVVGILWYLGLLVPFCFFFEKLVFGFADIRKQIAVQTVTFLAVFGLLRWLHPAFAMVQSSLMILLGFVIILVSGGITVLFAATFKESIDDLRRRQGAVGTAGVNVLGVVGTAFLLGLNNMHRRRVRTGLTCGTLVLMTSVVICFTSVRSDIVEQAIAVAKAPYQGILVKKADFEPLETVAGLVGEYGDRYDLCEREMYLGQQYLGQAYNPTLEIVYEPPEAAPRSLRLGSVVKLAAAEPLRHHLEFAGAPAWFTPEQERDSDEPCPVLVPDAMAWRLGLTTEAVETGDATVSINGRRFSVLGIFRAESYNRLYDLDGLAILPFDIEAMGNVASRRDSAVQAVLARDSDPRIPAENVVLCPAGRNLQIQLQYGNLHRVSMAIAMPNAAYKEARGVIDSYLERKAEPVFYGLGGVAFRGMRTRKTSLVGTIDLLLPLAIAALTVLNTMNGSVYERRDEIFVYNAVGIAPRYVFYMFLAEAAVYAVVGCVLGYLLSQGVGRLLSAFNLAGDMTTAFTSTATIYASLAVSAAVFVSTYFPARSAMRIAAPADDAGWRLPEPEDDLLRFRLPFTFTGRDRIAVLAFVDGYLHEHGEGSSERFLASPPRLGVDDEGMGSGGNGGYVPHIACTVWLKPFDLAVSQEMTLTVPYDRETGEYVAEIRLRRLSGTRESWLRLNVGFVRLLRRHLLHWRAVDDEARGRMLVRGKGLLERDLLGEAWGEGTGGP